MQKSNLPATDAARPVRPPGELNRLGTLLTEHKVAQVVEVFIVFAPALLVLLTFRVANISHPLWTMAGVWIANVCMMGLVAGGVWLRGDSWESIGLPLSRLTRSYVQWGLSRSLLVFVAALVAFIAGSIVMANVVGIPEPADMSKYDYLQGNLWVLLVSLASVYLVSSFGEEVIYRGFLITRLEPLLGGGTRWSRVSTWLLSSIIFGLAHFEWGAMGIGQTTCMGAALAAAFFILGRNLWPLILAHAYLDTLLLVPLFFQSN